MIGIPGPRFLPPFSLVRGSTVLGRSGISAVALSTPLAISLPMDESNLPRT